MIVYLIKQCGHQFKFTSRSDSRYFLLIFPKEESEPIFQISVCGNQTTSILWVLSPPD